MIMVWNGYAGFICFISAFTLYLMGFFGTEQAGGDLESSRHGVDGGWCLRAFSMACSGPFQYFSL